MAIALTKTLQTVQYDLYLRSQVLYVSSTQVVIDLIGYQSQGHFADGFMAILKRREIITNGDVVSLFVSLYPNSPSVPIQAAETLLVQSEAWYSGGSVVA